MCNTGGDYPLQTPERSSIIILIKFDSYSFTNMSVWRKYTTDILAAFQREFWSDLKSHERRKQGTHPPNR